MQAFNDLVAHQPARTFAIQVLSEPDEPARQLVEALKALQKAEKMPLDLNNKAKAFIPDDKRILAHTPLVEPGEVAAIKMTPMLGSNPSNSTKS